LDNLRSNFIVIYSFILALVILSAGCTVKEKLFVGKSTGKGEKGFAIYEFNTKSGNLKLNSEFDVGPSPSFFCFSGNYGFIFAINEVSDFAEGPSGGLTTLSYNPKNDSLLKIHELPVPNGGPCFISLSPGRQYLLIANYDGGSIAVVKLDEYGAPANVVKYTKFEPQEGRISHPHMINADPSGKRVYMTDLGLDRIMIYDFDPSSGELKPAINGIIKLPEGSGPRHFVFNKKGSVMYIINELNSTISVFEVNDSEGLRPMQNLSTLSEGFRGKSYCADIHISKNGKFLYGSNRGENSIVTFKIQNDGTLELAGRISSGGDWPRNFAINPNGEFLLVGNQKSENISVFRIDKKSGLPYGPVFDIKTTAPACLKF
jgi:6-phosphogluconolactonase